MLEITSGVESNILFSSLLCKEIKSSEEMVDRKTLLVGSILYILAYMYTHLLLHRHLSTDLLPRKPVGYSSRFHLDVDSIWRASNHTKLILLWTAFFNDHTWEVEEGYGTFNRLGCSVRDCYLTNDRGVLEYSSIVLFHPPDMTDEPPPKYRVPDQNWVFVILESPMALGHLKYDQNSWKNQFNWTMSYRLDSTILMPYGEVRKRDFPKSKRNYEDIARKKTKLVAWMVSHCKTHSKRENYVAELQKYIPVDIYGKCGDKMCYRDYKAQDGDCQNVLNSTYLFYLAFENAHCTDYLTEKLFKILPLDIVPIVRGSEELYRRQIPMKWYINTEDYSSPQELAEYLLYLQANPTEYAKLFTGKEYFDIIFHMGLKNVPSWCDLCQKVHAKTQTTVGYSDITQWWNVRDCTILDDIPLQIIPIVIGMSVALIILVVTVTVSCFFCRCCPGYKKRQKRLQKAAESQQQTPSHDLPDIAVQASGHPMPQDRNPSPAPINSGSSPITPVPMRMNYLQHQATCTVSTPTSHGHGHGHGGQGEILHCGCQWSPALSHSPMTDLDTIMQKLYGESSDLEPLPDYSIEKPPPYTEHDIHNFDLSKKFETKTLGRRFRENKAAMSPTPEPSKTVTRAISDPSQLCMKTFRPVLMGQRSETDTRRDSGVLIEEGELAGEPIDDNTEIDDSFVLPNFQPALRSPRFLGYSSSQSSLEMDPTDIKVTVHSHGMNYH